MNVRINYTSDEVKNVIGATCSRRGAEDLKNDLFVELCKSVVSAFYEIYDDADAFIRSSFYLCDLMDEEVLTPEQVKDLDVFIHTKALTHHRKGEKDNGRQQNNHA